MMKYPQSRPALLTSLKLIEDVYVDKLFRHQKEAGDKVYKLKRPCMDASMGALQTLWLRDESKK